MKVNLKEFEVRFKEEIAYSMRRLSAEDMIELEYEDFIIEQTIDLYYNSIFEEFRWK